MNRPRILIVGGGQVGMHTAYRLQRKLRSAEATVTLVDPQPAMTYRPLLAMAAAGSIEPRHAVVPLRQVLTSCRIVTGEVSTIDVIRRVATVLPLGGEPVEEPYDVLVMAPGAVMCAGAVPGLAATAAGIRTVGQAVQLQGHVLSRLDLAASATGSRRRRALTFVFVGGGPAGVEAVAELADMVRRVLPRYPELAPVEARWVLVEAAERILPEVSPAPAAAVAAHLRERGIEVRTGTRVESLVDGHVVLSGGEELDADTVVWTAGLRANPVTAPTGLPVDAEGRLVCTDELQVFGADDVWSAGDCAAVPDLSRADPTALCPPNSQHAVRQARRLADNIVAVLRGRRPRRYLPGRAGSVSAVSLGQYQGVATYRGLTLHGWPAWVLHRAYHLGRLPGLSRKLRILADWTLARCLRTEVAPLGPVPPPASRWQPTPRTAEPVNLILASPSSAR